MVTKQVIIDEINALPPETLSELRAFIEFLRFKSGVQSPAPVDSSKRKMWRSGLQDTFGMWAGRSDVADDGVVYVQTLRQGHRLNDLLGTVDEAD